MPDTADAIRKKGLVICDNFHKHRWHIRYSQSRPTQLRWPRFVTRQDCSGLVSCVMHLLDVMPGVDWRYQNTWSLIPRGKGVRSVKEAKPMDVVFYGPAPNNPVHVALYIGGGQVLSNGHYPMQKAPIDYRSDRIAIRRYIGVDPTT